MPPDPQAARRFKRVEIGITVQQRVVVFNAPRSHQNIDAAAHGVALGPQRTIVLGRHQGKRFATRTFDAQTFKQAARQAMVLLTPKSIR